MMKQFKIIPILGRKTDVLPDDSTMLQAVEQGIALSHDCGGENWDLKRYRNACTKSFGDHQRSNSANAQATLCMGLFELYDGTNRNYIFFDNGLVYKYDGSWDTAEITVSTPVTFANSLVDIYSVIRIGSYMVWADRAEHTPYKWADGDANSTKLIQSGTEYKFRYLVSFQRRVVGLYSDQTNGNIDVRWSTSWPSTAITSLNYPAGNQLYIPNDDPITGGIVLNRDQCFITCEDSIQQMVYYPDYSTPFRIYTIVPDQGFENHHSLVNANGRIYGFNRNLGFCEYTGGTFLNPIGNDILADLNNINSNYYALIVGCHIPTEKKIKWTVPLTGSSSCNYILSYNYDNGQWEFDRKTARYIDTWKLYSTQTWTTLEAAVGGTGIWSDAGTTRWADWTTAGTETMIANTDGHVYDISGETANTGTSNGYRIEPVLSFGNERTFKNILEIWFDIGEAGDFSIDVYHRSGNTTGELLSSAWTPLDSVSANSPYDAVVKCSKSARLHQIKWGCDDNSEPFVVNGITFKYTEGGEV